MRKKSSNFWNQFLIWFFAIIMIVGALALAYGPMIFVMTIIWHFVRKVW